jgi:hypothetical protein
MEEIQSQDRGFAGAAQQWFPSGKEVDMWRATVGDPNLMKKKPDKIPMFARFIERLLQRSSQLLRSIPGDQAPLGTF